MNEIIIEVLVYLVIAVVLIPSLFRHLLQAQNSRSKDKKSAGVGVVNGYIFNVKTNKFEPDQDGLTR